ncbi:DUF2798 domain-containing protein [Metabacillus malikii]|uniref:DUF2798 domain-containing protein n=1 Tax=Metabacillus malikii TaxID=1504265 RepID=A0ABT9ZIH2_9BACI|nr:DUF2798 domain-containing protein [Metabacillus malikii]MDQ0232081.1 hypothetical protein [Metabacillus malikii]
MPSTKRESFYFGVMMCTGMVIVMSIYNLYISGMAGKMTINQFFIQLLIGFAIALLLDLFIVGPIAKKIAFSLPYDKSKKVFVVLSISFFMVLGMVTWMSLYGLGTAYFSNGIENSFVQNYLAIFMKNFIVALPLQLLIMGPLVRFVFMKIKGQRKVIA